MHSEPLFDEAAVPDGVQTLARAAQRADVIAAPVVLGRSVQRLVDVADPMAEELERGQLLLVGRVRRRKDREVVLDRADHALFGHGALIVIEAGGFAREIDEVLGRTLSWPIGPVARRAERGELRVLPDERDQRWRAVSSLPGPVQSLAAPCSHVRLRLPPSRGPVLRIYLGERAGKGDNRLPMPRVWDGEVVAGEIQEHPPLGCRHEVLRALEPFKEVVNLHPKRLRDGVQPTGGDPIAALFVLVRLLIFGDG